MGGALKFKPRAKRVRMIVTDGPQGIMSEYPGKVFAVIGPFDSHTDKPELQDMLTTVCRGFNLEERH